MLNALLEFVSQSAEDVPGSDGVHNHGYTPDNTHSHQNPGHLPDVVSGGGYM